MEITLDAFINTAIQEDIGSGDHTSFSCIPADATGQAQLIIKQNGILAGVNVAQHVFRHIDDSITFQQNICDGIDVKKGDIAFTISGKVQSILKSERLVLNIMQRMSGIATETRKYVDKLQGLHTKVIDTRKTTPGMRMLEKLAVRIGGGTNHRMGLYDMILIKDNHVDFAGGINKALQKTAEYLKANNLNLKVEIETRNLDEIQQVLDNGFVNRIMLDNFDVATTHKAVEMINHRYETESSGGITLETIRDYAECGVDFISVGALTHQIKSLDLSLKAV